MEAILPLVIIPLILPALIARIHQVLTAQKPFTVLPLLTAVMITQLLVHRSVERGIVQLALCQTPPAVPFIAVPAMIHLWLVLKLAEYGMGVHARCLNQAVQVARPRTPPLSAGCLLKFLITSGKTLGVNKKNALDIVFKAFFC